MDIRDATAEDLPDILALNERHQHFLSPLTLEQLEWLHQRAAYHRVVWIEGALFGFLIAFREGSPYASINYRWFDARFDSFLYIDRVVAAEAGQGIGTALYDNVISYAAALPVPYVCCEFDTEPPNERSARFHRRFGFQEVGTQQVDGGKKQVSLQRLEVAANQKSA